MSTQEQRNAAEKLIQFTEQQVSAEITDLRRRRDEVLYYISQIDNPNRQTLWHIRNILTGDDSIYGLPVNNEGADNA